MRLKTGNWERVVIESESFEREFNSADRETRYNDVVSLLSSFLK